MYHINTLYTLNLQNVIYKLYLNLKKKKEKADKNL